jgi:hypothetical protein
MDRFERLSTYEIYRNNMFILLEVSDVIPGAKFALFPVAPAATSNISNKLTTINMNMTAINHH